MPKPPNFDAMTNLGFVTNYWLQCGPSPNWLHVSLSRPAQKTLFLILFSFDFDDILAEIFDPNKGRKRNKGRHGRKKPRRFRFPDHNAFIGKAIRGRINPFNGLNYSATRLLFPLFNLQQGVAITAAVVEGLTDVGFEHLWGIINIDPRHCWDFKHISRRLDDPIVAGGVGPPLQSVGIPILEQINGFFDSPFQTTTSDTDFFVTVQMTLVGRRDGNPVTGVVALGPSNNVIQYESSKYSLALHEVTTREVKGSFKAGETAAWGLGPRDGFVTIVEARALGWSDTPIF